MAGQSFFEEEWSNLYPLLRSRVAQWVNTSRVPTWTRQRESIIEDLVQDALLKTFVYARDKEKGGIDSLERFSVVTAYRCFVDLRRHDLRMLPLIQNQHEPVEYEVTWLEVDLSEQAINNVHHEQLFKLTAIWAVKLPDKQRTAFLTDLANRMYFDPLCLTPLQQAFSSVGICLFDYQRLLPDDAGARARHAAHLSLAYKRLALQAYMYQFMFVASPYAA